MVDFTQRGSVLFSPGRTQSQTRYGVVVALSGNGLVMAVGEPYWSGTYYRQGRLLIYDIVAGVPTYRGEAPAPAPGSNVGYGETAALNADGTILVFYANGSLYTYNWSGSAWVSRNAFVTGAAPGAIALSPDGQVMAWSNTAYSTSTGIVYLYDAAGAAWSLRGNLAGYATNTAFGSGLAFSYDATYLAVGAGNHDTPNADQGAVYVYQWTGSTWTDHGSNPVLAGDAAATDGFGTNVALSYTGGTLAISAPLWEGGLGNQGAAYVLDWSGSAYAQRSLITQQDAASGDQFGHGLALSGSAAVLVAGASIREDVDPLPGTPMFVGSAMASHSNATNMTVSLTALTGGIATSPSAGDVVVLVLAKGGNTIFSSTIVTAGYTAATAQLLGDDARDSSLTVFYKVMGATPDSSVQISAYADGGANVIAIAYVLRYADPITVLDVNAVTASGIDSAIADAPELTTVTDRAMLLACYANTGDGTPSAKSATISGLSNVVTRYQVNTAGTNSLFCAIGRRVIDPAGPYNPGVWSGGETSTSDSWVAATLAIRPAATFDVGGVYLFDALEYHLSGTVLDDTGAPAARTVRVYRRDTGKPYAEQTSHPSTGAFDIRVYEDTEYTVICLDNDAGTAYNALVFDKVMPDVVT